MSSKIDNQLFSAHEHALEHESCPKCVEHGRSGELELRNGKHGAFLGCNQYPDCDYIRPLHQNDGHIVKHLGVACPKCQHELVLRQGRYGMFIGCSDFPNCYHIESLSTQPDEQAPAAIACPECGKGHLVERKTRHGKSFHACDAYPKCRFAVNQTPVAGRCEKCGFGLLVSKKRAAGNVLMCADKKCQHQQQG
ncbi:DNA topoisomerase family protein [Vibrio agarivorans]|uniref:DNA topoisomerase family protein n=1 Tax=Vibrio agarivorans TaxID=153622 RepID=UPI0025B3EB9E|nr:topoisomerase DNA-binding C4 zinc finger domain-containing protein [Vibrio agarivorans]MDN3661946.1 topoisomerase DNA-binding C4 zinc finger domain-containing protein [Vibrio agarivorans]